MRRLLHIRIVRPELKLAFIVGVWLLGFPVLWLLNLMSAPFVPTSVASFAITISGVLLCARIFRGHGEPLRPERAWWRMTAWPKLSRVLGLLFALGAVMSAPSIVLGALGLSFSQESPPPALLPAIDAFVFFGALAFLYLNSATRLKRAGIARPAPEFRPESQQRLS